MDEDDAIFRRKYSHAHARMMANKETIDLVEGAEQKIANIKRQLEATTKNYAI